MTEQNSTSITVKDCKLNFLQYEYYRYSQLIQNQIQHVERLYKESIISINIRNNCMRQLSELILFMNDDVFNPKFNEIKDSGSSEYNDIEFVDQTETAEESDDDIAKTDKNSHKNTQKKDDHVVKSLDKNKENFSDSLIDKNIFDYIGYQMNMKNDKNLSTIFELFKNNKVNNLNEILFDNFDKVRDKLLEVCKNVGFYSIEDALNVLVGNSHKEYIKFASQNEIGVGSEKGSYFREELDLYNMVFIPVDYKTTPTDAKEGFIKSDMEWQLEKPVPNSDIYIDSYAEVKLHIPNTSICYTFGGYFINDPIHCIIRTSQIYRPFIYNKKKMFQKVVTANQFINDKFAEIYIKHIPIGEILSYDEKSFTQKISADYLRYSEITKMDSFKHQMDEFQKDNNLKNMFNIIRLLLMGPDECINVAGLLFGLTKDKKYGAEIIAELIYRRLAYTLQIRLKKSSINLKNELEKLKAMSESDVDMKRQIVVNMNIPKHIKKIILEKSEEMKFGNGETSKQKTYVDILMKYPWQNTDTKFEMLRYDDSKCRKMMDNVYDVLKKRVYGHEECKNTIRELVCKMIMNPNSPGKAIGLCGPPGVGKTLIAKGLGEALGIPCISISLCGVEDPAVLNGHSFTYSAAQPGLIVRKMVEAGSARCIMFFDELDKASQKHGVNEIQNVLINVTDPNMNTSFSDKFFECGFPLNHVLFVFSYNDESKIDPILLNRIQRIEVKSYSVKEKLKICQDFLLKEIMEGIGLEHKSILIDDKDIEYIADNFTHEAGVRELKNKLETLFLKLNVDRIYRRGVFKCKCKEHIILCDECKNCEKCNAGKYHDCEKCKLCKDCVVECKPDCKMIVTPANPIIVDNATIIKYMNKPKHDIEKIHPTPEIGICNALFATVSGHGGILRVTCYKNFGFDKFNLKLTGNLQETIKESCQFAFTMATNMIKTEYINKFIEETPGGLHVHFPSGSSKDGPSAGAIITICYISRILNKRVRNDFAMTGTADFNGTIGAIGGLPSKLRGAKAALIKRVFVPKENEKDYDEILKSDQELFKDFEVTLVSHVKEVIPYILIEDDGSSLDMTKYFNF